MLWSKLFKSQEILKEGLLRLRKWLGIVARAFNSSIQETEVEGLHSKLKNYQNYIKSPYLKKTNKQLPTKRPRK